MYELIDRPVTDLDRGGRLLVWSMRSWVQAVGERACPAQIIAPGFAHWSMLAGLAPFTRMMALFNCHALENLHFCAIHCNHISEHSNYPPLS